MQRTLSLHLRNLFFTILQPGVVTVLIPYLILRSTRRDMMPPEWAARHYIAAVVMLIGASILLTCVVRFVTEGRGTISPLDPTTKLVVRGLYRYSRNPMYLGAITLLAGESLFWWSASLATYAVIVFVAFNLFIIFHEEPRLRREFGDEYHAYASSVRRWV